MTIKRAIAALSFLVAILATTLVSASELAYDHIRNGSIPVLSLGTVQTVSYLVTSVATTNVIGGSKRTVVMILCTTDCHVVKGTSPTATTSDTFIPAMTLVWVWVDSGTDKLAFIRETADGTAYVTEAP